MDTIEAHVRPARPQEAGLDTFPKLLLHNAANWPDAVAMREKEFGVWNEFTWSDYRDRVKEIALGLRSLGLQRGEVVSFIGKNRPEMVWSELATHAVGCASLGPAGSPSGMLNASGRDPHRLAVGAQPSAKSPVSNHVVRVKGSPRVLEHFIIKIHAHDRPRLGMHGQISRAKTSAAGDIEYTFARREFGCE